MNESSLLFAAALTASVVSPAILAVITGWQRKAEKLLDWQRQDSVAATVARSVEAAASAARETARLLVESDKKIDGKLDVIHTLVNSSMTAALQAQLDSTVREALLMRKLNAINPSEEAEKEIAATEAVIYELRGSLAERQSAAHIVEKQMSHAAHQR